MLKIFVKSTMCLAVAGLSGAGLALAAGDRGKDRSREVVVGCNSTVAYDPGGCERPARKKCKGEAEFWEVLASTPLAGSGLHTISARYRCVRARTPER